MTIEQIGILLSLLLTILGWSITAYYQRQILEKQIKADKEKLTQQFAHEKEMLELQYQQKVKELEQQGQRQQKLDILPPARDKMIETFSRIAHLNRRVLTYPDLNSMTDSQLQDIVERLEFSKSQKEELLQASNKSEYFIEKQFWYDLDKAEKCLSDFHNYLVFKKIFVDQVLFDHFNSADKLFTETLNAIKIGRQARDYQMAFKTGDELNSKAPSMIDNIERLIQERLPP